VSSSPANRPRGEDPRFWTFLALGAGAFMSSMGASAVNAVLPVIRTGMGSDVATIQWVVTVFLLVVSSLLLGFGRLGDLLGHRPVYLWGFSVFVTGSLLCGFAVSPAWLIAARAVQALGAAMLFANSPGILTKVFPPSARGRALGLLSMTTYLGLMAGPALGGLLTERWTWRGVFFMNIPFGLLALGLGLRYIPRDIPSETEKRFDFAGAATFTAGLIALLLGLNQGGAWGWGSLRTVFALLAALILLVAFVVIERRVQGPMLDLDLFRSRIFTAAAASAGLNYVAIYTCLFLMPFYLIQARGLSAGRAGLLLTVQPMMMAIFAPLSGILSDRIGSRLPSTVGMATLAFGMVLLSRLGPETPLWGAAVGLGVVGLGTGIFISPNSSALMGGAPRHRQGIAGGILATTRNVGMVLGVGMAGAVFTTQLARGADLHIALRAGFLSAAFAAAIGVPVSAARGPHPPGEPSR
jgi:EmrB/QacA subfamily drug resistance transporter